MLKTSFESGHKDTQYPLIPATYTDKVSFQNSVNITPMITLECHSGVLYTLNQSDKECCRQMKLSVFPFSEEFVIDINRIA